MLSTYIHPKTPQGMVLWGTISVGILTWFLLRVHGQIEEVWPHRCRMMKSQLSPLPKGAPFTPSSSQFWRLSLDHRDDLLIPKDQYTQVAIKEGPTSRQLTLKGKSFTVYAHSRPFMSPKTLEELYVYLSGVSQTQIDYTQLTKWLNLSAIYRHGIQQTPSMITCNRKDPYLEMIDLTSLLIRQDDLNWLPSLWQKSSWILRSLEMSSHLKVILPPHHAKVGSLWEWSWQPTQDLESSSTGLSETPPPYFSLLFLYLNNQFSFTPLQKEWSNQTEYPKLIQEL